MTQLMIVLMGKELNEIMTRYLFISIYFSDTVSAAGGTTTTPSKSPSSTIPILRERNNVGSSTSGDCLKSRIRPLATGSLPQSSGSVTSPPKSIPDYSSIVRESFQVTRNSDGRPVPVASTGILTKAMEYMFGW